MFKYITFFGKRIRFGFMNNSLFLCTFKTVIIHIFRFNFFAPRQWHLPQSYGNRATIFGSLDPKFTTAKYIRFLWNFKTFELLDFSRSGRTEWYHKLLCTVMGVLCSITGIYTNMTISDLFIYILYCIYLL